MNMEKMEMNMQELEKAQENNSLEAPQLIEMLDENEEKMPEMDSAEAHILVKAQETAAMLRQRKAGILARLANAYNTLKRKN